MLAFRPRLLQDLVLAFATSILTMCGALAQPAAKPPLVRTTVIPDPDVKPNYYCWEPHITADPENPDRVVVSAMYRGTSGEGETARGDCRLVAWRSENAGRSWSATASPLVGKNRPAGRIGADAVVAFGTGKTCWMLGCDYDFPVSGRPNYSSIKVSRSDDGGEAWKPPITVTELDNDKNGKGIVDKPWLAVDRTDGKGRGNLYVAWSRINEDNKRLELWCATLPRDAKQFSAAAQLGEPLDYLKSSRGGIMQDSIHHVQLAARPDGTVDAIWRVSPTDQLVHASSLDSGATFSKPAPIADGVKSSTGQFPSLTVTPDGKLFAAWVHDGNVFGSVLASGKWSAPQPVAGVPSEGISRSRPAVAATADALWVLSYRRENRPSRVSVMLYRSTDQGEKWEEYCTLASREQSDDKLRKFSPGDYVGLAAVKDRVYAAYVLPGEGQDGPRPRLYVAGLETGTKR